MYMRPEPIIEDRASRVPVPRVFQHVYERLHPPQVVRSIEPAPPVGTPHEQVEDLLHRRRYHDALDKVDSIVASAPDEPRAHHLRGKALLALGRLPDARAAFDRACTLQPKLLEAMLLRREVDRGSIPADRPAASRVSPKIPRARCRRARMPERFRALSAFRCARRRRAARRGAPLRPPGARPPRGRASRADAGDPRPGPPHPRDARGTAPRD